MDESFGVNRRAGRAIGVASLVAAAAALWVWTALHCGVLVVIPLLWFGLAHIALTLACLLLRQSPFPSARVWPSRPLAAWLAAMKAGPRRILPMLLALLVLAWMAPARAALPDDIDLTLQGHYWTDSGGTMTIDDVAGGDTTRPQRLTKPQSFQLGAKGALWIRYDLDEFETSERWYLMLSGAAFVNDARLYTPRPEGGWSEQRAGDVLPVSAWTHPNAGALFEAPAGTARSVWLRLQNSPAPTSVFVRLLTADRLQHWRAWTYLLIGGYLGFGLLVFIVGLIHARLYRDRAFVAYCAYVACMVWFQLAFTGLGGLFLWPWHAAFNDAAPAVSMLLMVATGIWFIRESTAVARHSRALDRAVIAFCWFGVFYTVPYTLLNNTAAYGVLNLYALTSVLLSAGLCLWTWRKGETYSGWLFLGFLPIHLAYPFPALRAAGVLADSWATQYAVLIGSALEIPLLLYILHRRARDFSENRARLQALDSTDPLTGLALQPVLQLRLRDALKRGARLGHRCTVLLVEVANFDEIASQRGREAADRALVVVAGRLRALVREVDTVCRVADARFAVLLEGPQTDDARRLLAQHVVARGLEPVPQSALATGLRLRVVSAYPPDGAIELTPEGNIDEQRLLQRMGRVMDRLRDDPRRMLQHIEQRADARSAGANEFTTD